MESCPTKEAQFCFHLYPKTPWSSFKGTVEAHEEWVHVSGLTLAGPAYSKWSKSVSEIICLMLNGICEAPVILETHSQGQELSIGQKVDFPIDQFPIHLYLPVCKYEWHLLFPSCPCVCYLCRQLLQSDVFKPCNFNSVSVSLPRQEQICDAHPTCVGIWRQVCGGIDMQMPADTLLLGIVFVTCFWFDLSGGDGTTLCRTEGMLDSNQKASTRSLGSSPKEREWW
jgi:hypothetical protein